MWRFIELHHQDSLVEFPSALLWKKKGNESLWAKCSKLNKDYWWGSESMSEREQSTHCVTLILMTGSVGWTFFVSTLTCCTDVLDKRDSSFRSFETRNCLFKFPRSVSFKYLCLNKQYLIKLVKQPIFIATVCYFFIFYHKEKTVSKDATVSLPLTIKAPVRNFMIVILALPCGPIGTYHVYLMKISQLALIQVDLVL